MNVMILEHKLYSVNSFLAGCIYLVLPSGVLRSCLRRLGKLLPICLIFVCVFSVFTVQRDVLLKRTFVIVNWIGVVVTRCDQ